MDLTQAPVLITGHSTVAARLIRYTVKDKPGSKEPRVLYAVGINCRSETAEREFAAHRRKHGKQGAMRKAGAIYKLPDDEVATHVRRARPNGRKYWSVAKDGEEATHVRVEGYLVKENEAIHDIYSFGLDSVNPNDALDVQRAFDYVYAQVRSAYASTDGECGVQAHLVGQADAKGMLDENGEPLTDGGKFHVHVVINAVVYKEITLDGNVWRPGQKLSGALTNIDSKRARHDEFVRECGSEWGFEQRLASVAAQKKETRSVMDRRMAAKGAISNHDIIRAAFEDSMNDPRSVDLDSFVEVMSQHDVTVNHRVTRAGKPGEKHALSYRLDDMKTPVRGTTLGDHYAFDSTIQQLEANACGEERERRPKQPRVGAPKPLSMPTAQELAEAKGVVERLARAERTAQAEDQAAADFFPAILEDFDAATEANRLGDFTELARLANATRAKGAQQRTRRAQTTGITSPQGTAQAQPVMAPEPGMPAPAAKAAKLKPSIEERMRAVLAEVNEQANVNTQRMIADYMTTKASAAEPQTLTEPPALSATGPIPGGTSRAGVREAQATQEAAQMAPAATGEPAAAGTVSTAQAAEEDTEKLQRINERNSRSGLPSVSPAQHAANQAMTREERKRRLEHPELFDDAEPAAMPSQQGHRLKD